MPVASAIVANPLPFYLYRSSELHRGYALSFMLEYNHDLAPDYLDSLRFSVSIRLGSPLRHYEHELELSGPDVQLICDRVPAFSLRKIPPIAQSTSSVSSGVSPSFSSCTWYESVLLFSPAAASSPSPAPSLSLPLSSPSASPTEPEAKGVSVATPAPAASATPVPVQSVSTPAPAVTSAPDVAVSAQIEPSQSPVPAPVVTSADGFSLVVNKAKAKRVAKKAKAKAKAKDMLTCRPYLEGSNKTPADIRALSDSVLEAAIGDMHDRYHSLTRAEHERFGLLSFEASCRQPLEEFYS